jgi:4-diphosphocytidyl-2-C-methyl-D-erythritol kinase
LEPVIGDVLRALEATEGCLLARMSGSGATCFAIYPTMGAADAAARRLSSERPDWWVAGGLLGDQQAFAAPRPVS